MTIDFDIIRKKIILMEKYLFVKHCYIKLKCVKDQVSQKLKLLGRAQEWSYSKKHNDVGH